MRKCRQKDLTGCNQSVVGTAPNSSLNNTACNRLHRNIFMQQYKRKYEGDDHAQLIDRTTFETHYTYTFGQCLRQESVTSLRSSVACI